MDPAYPRTGKRLPAILGSAKKPGRLAAHDGLGDRAWLVVDDVHELARRSRISGSKKLQARTVAYRFVCCNLRSTHYSSGHTPWSGRNTFGQGVTHVRIGRGPACPDHSVTYRSALRSSISLPASQLSRDHLATAVADGLREITARLLPPPRRRSNPRVVKRKMSNFGVKRDEHRNRPQPTRDPADTVTVARTGAPSRSIHQPRHDQANLKSLVLTLASIR